MTKTVQEQLDEATDSLAKQQAMNSDLLKRLSVLEQANLASSTSTTTATTTPTTPATLGDFLGVSLLLSAGRVTVGEFGVAPLMTIDQRAALDVTERYKFEKAAITGLKTTFQSFTNIADLSKMSTIPHIYDFNLRNLEICKHLWHHALANMFQIIQLTSGGNLVDPDTPAGAPVDLLTDFHLATLASVRASCSFWSMRGSEVHRKILSWSFTFILNSCGKDLRTILTNKMNQYNPTEHVGPLLYWHLLDQLTSCSEETIRNITKALSSMHISAFEGESITKVSQHIRATLAWLKRVNWEPVDKNILVLRILETCSVPDFNTYLSSVKSHASLSKTP